MSKLFNYKYVHIVILFFFNWIEIIFSTIFDRIGSNFISLKFVGSSISPDLRIGIIIECSRYSGNTLLIIDVSIIRAMYGVALITFSICCSLIWLCQVDLVFVSIDIYILLVTSAACTGWGLHNGVFSVIR